MPDQPQMGLQEDLNDAKALDLLCGTDADQRRAGDYYYQKYAESAMNCVRDKFPSLPSDLVWNAVHDAFLVFCAKAASDPAFDQDNPQKYIFAIALNKACDLFRQRTHRGKFKEECIDDIAKALEGTQTAKDWSAAVTGGTAREIQELFHQELAQCGDRQRKIGRLMVDQLERNIEDAELAELYRSTYREQITVPAAKRAREEVRKKLRDLLIKKTRVKL